MGQPLETSRFFFLSQVRSHRRRHCQHSNLFYFWEGRDDAPPRRFPILWLACLQAADGAPKKQGCINGQNWPSEMYWLPWHILPVQSKIWQQALASFTGNLFWISTYYTLGYKIWMVISRGRYRTPLIWNAPDSPDRFENGNILVTVRYRTVT